MSGYLETSSGSVHGVCLTDLDVSMSGRSGPVKDVLISIRDEFEMSPTATAESKLIEDLGFDSLQMIQLIYFVEELAGLNTEEPSAEFPLLITLQDAVDYYFELREAHEAD